MDTITKSIVEYIDARLDTMVAHPGTWGSSESLELQALMLFELRSFVLRPVAYEQNPHEARETYFDFLSKRFPRHNGMPMTHILAELGRTEEMPEFIAKVRRAINKKLRSEIETDEIDLILKLEFKHERETDLATVCGYYETFQESWRGASIKDGKRLTREVKREIGRLTSFPVPSLRTTRENGAGACVIIPLAHRDPQQLSLDPTWGASAVERTNDALRKLVTMLRWAASTSDSSSIVSMFENRGKHAADMMRFFASKALEVLPSNIVEGEHKKSTYDFASVGLFGKLVPKGSTHMLASHSARLRSLLDVDDQARTKSVTGIVRAWDMDQKWFRLRPQTNGTNGTAHYNEIKCWTDLDKDNLQTAVRAAAEFRNVSVTGKLYPVREHVAYLIVEQISLSTPMIVKSTAAKDTAFAAKETLEGIVARIP